MFYVISALVFTGCAAVPEAISPAYVSQVTYSDWSCSQLKNEAIHLQRALAVASEQQKKARNNDIAGIIWLGVPVSSLSGDNIAPQIANLKGHKEAVRVVIAKKGCA